MRTRSAAFDDPGQSPPFQTGGTQLLRAAFPHRGSLQCRHADQSDKAFLTTKHHGGAVNARGAKGLQEHLTVVVTAWYQHPHTARVISTPRSSSSLNQAIQNTA